RLEEDPCSLVSVTSVPLLQLTSKQILSALHQRAMVRLSEPSLPVDDFLRICIILPPEASYTHLYSCAGGVSQFQFSLRMTHSKSALDADGFLFVGHYRSKYRSA
ncbi:unnamed protein product, partial [Staurois parvus]